MVIGSTLRLTLVFALAALPALAGNNRWTIKGPDGGSVNRDRSVALLDPRFDQVERFLVLQVRGDPAGLAEAVAGGLGEGKIDGHIARLREFDRDGELAVLAGAHEEERFLLYLNRAVAPRKLLVSLGECECEIIRSAADVMA